MTLFTEEERNFWDYLYKKVYGTATNEQGVSLYECEEYEIFDMVADIAYDLNALKRAYGTINRSDIEKIFVLNFIGNLGADINATTALMTNIDSIVSRFDTLYGYKYESSKKLNQR